MSCHAAALSAPKAARTAHRWRFALTGMSAVVAAVLANLLVYVAGRRLDDDDRFVPLADVERTILFTLVPAFGAVLLYGVLGRLVGDPLRAFSAVAIAVFVVTVILDLAYARSVHGATLEQTAILGLMHFVAAGVVVGTLTSYDRPHAR